MKRATIYWWIDGVLGLAGLGVLTTGLLMEFVLPAHSRGATVWGWTRHDWGELHFWLAVGVLSLLAVHLVLHWGWVCTMGRKMLGGANVPVRRGGRWAMGAVTVAALAAVVGGFLWLTAASVRDDGGGGGGWGQGRGRHAGQVGEEGLGVGGWGLGVGGEISAGRTVQDPGLKGPAWRPVARGVVVRLLGGGLSRRTRRRGG